MSHSSKSVFRLSALALGALLGGLPAGAAMARMTMSPQEADAMAQHDRDQAAHFSALGGVGYKTGLVQRADADAAKHEQMAEKLAAPPEEPPVASPEAEHYSKLADHYEAMGGVGYKSGLVRSAEAQEQKYEPAPAPSNEADEPCPATKPVVQVAECTP